MQLRIWLILSLLSAEAAAGCLAHHSNIVSSGPPTNHPNFTQPPLFELGHCTGFSGATHAYPQTLAPSKAPAGWGENAVSFVGLEGFDCHRISIGPFERGPVRIVLDAHTNFSSPSHCAENLTARTGEQFLNVFLVNDRE